MKDISFSVKKGEMLGIVGFNGSGKTTLLKIIGKIYSPDGGEVTTSGNLIPFLELGAGFNGELTARDNIIIYGVILGFTKKQIKEKIESIAKFAEVERFLDTKLKNFSSGMNVRLAFSTAIQVDPDILLVDEVLSVG
ncbi:MAG: ABC transporter ATP-binding protein, partial [Patescibacteria group bacterium]|nr:ABC transporter ATP-binding protein [Patescibacteria group bacterium]